MSSEGCIHPDCKCRAYKKPGQAKGTLLLLRLCCRQCGHHGSEHRRLTAVDDLVREEVEGAASVRCTHLIPLNDIPHSPVFRPYDPIPIPYDTSEHDQGAAVQCTCAGFTVPSLVKLWQSFRTYSMSAAVSALPKITCSNCQHALQTHQLIVKPHTKSGITAEGGSGICRHDLSGFQQPQLTLKASAKLAFTPFKDCVQLLPAGDKSGRMTLVGLHSPSEGELHIIMSSVQLTTGGKDTCTAVEEPIIDNFGCVNDRLNASSHAKMLDNSTSCVNGCDVTEGREAELSTEDQLGAAGNKKSRKRKRTTGVNLVPTRKSARLLKQAGTKRDNHVTVRLLEEKERERRERELEQARAEQQALCGCIVEFVSSLEERESFTHYPLPEAICRDGVEMMRVTRLGKGLILALGTTGGVFVITTAGLMEGLVWATLCVDTNISNKATIKSMSWLVKSADRHCHLCVGYSGGSVVVWRIHLNTTTSQIEHSVISRRQDTRADITMSTWAPDKKLLAVGSQIGEVLFYSCDSDDSYTHSQTVHCGGSAITCATWMHNSSMLAVGGTDDSIHILQRKPSTRTVRCPPHSLFSYFKPVDANKFIYTHWLRGHCSFVSSLLSLDKEGTLLSLGWDGRLLFWQGIEPIRDTNIEVFPIEDNSPQCGFKLGPSTTTQFLPLSMCDAMGFSALVLLIDRTRDMHLTYYTFSPILISHDIVQQHRNV